MNYLRLYIKICRNAKGRPYSKDKEKHHVFPVSIYGKNNFTVNLTLREHFVAHLLLAKAFIKRYGNNHYKTCKMKNAVHKIVYRLAKKIQGKITSRHYEIARKFVRENKTGKKRPDMIGKSYFGANESTIKLGIQKMVEKKTGMKINYPKDRKPRIQLESTNQKISNTRLKTLEKYKNMSKEEFLVWIKSHNLFTKEGKINSNITRAIFARNEKIEDYYK
jgi:hypothetical protein